MASLPDYTHNSNKNYVASLNKYVFSSVLKVAKQSMLRMFDGREFHRVDAETEKER